MNMKQACPVDNFRRAEELILTAAKDRPDVILLPETWNTGFFPKNGLAAVSDKNGGKVISGIGTLAAQLGINIAAGSIADERDGKIFNSSYVFSASGELLARYDKAHLFSFMDEDGYFTAGEAPCVFEINGIRCAVVICYDIRFPEYVRTLALEGVRFLFVVSQWPAERLSQLHILLKARAVENRIFVACCNSCAEFDGTVFAGNSVIIDPYGETLAQAGTKEEIITAVCDENVIKAARMSMNVFSDRRPELYHL